MRWNDFFYSKSFNSLYHKGKRKEAAFLWVNITNFTTGLPWTGNCLCSSSCRWRTFTLTLMQPWPHTATQGTQWWWKCFLLLYNIFLCYLHLTLGQRSAKQLRSTLWDWHWCYHALVCQPAAEICLWAGLIPSGDTLSASRQQRHLQCLKVSETLFLPQAL